jgi:hypothetical protein
MASSRTGPDTPVGRALASDLIRSWSPRGGVREPGVCPG